MTSVNALDGSAANGYKRERDKPPALYVVKHNEWKETPYVDIYNYINI